MNLFRPGLLAVLLLSLPACKTLPASSSPPASSPAPTTATPPPPAKPSPAPRPKPGTLSEIPLETAFSLHSSRQVFWIDARPAFVHAFGHIPGSLSLPRRSPASAIEASLPSLRQALAQKKTLVVYCTDLACPDARALAEKLSSHGLHLAVLEGGYAAWTEAGLPTE